jgi:hypothetical protein
MNIGNKHAREAQKLVAAFKEIDPSLDPKMTDDKTTETFEMVVTSINIGPKIYSLAWISSGVEYYLASWSAGKNIDAGQESFSNLYQAKTKMMEILSL